MVGKSELLFDGDDDSADDDSPLLLLPNQEGGDGDISTRSLSPISPPSCVPSKEEYCGLYCGLGLCIRALNLVSSTTCLVASFNLERRF